MNTSRSNIVPGEVALAAGDASAVVDLRGGGLRALEHEGRPLVAGYPAGTVPHGRRGHVLAPWPNRLRGGHYRWDRVDYALPITDVAHDAAIHGLVDGLTWSITAPVTREVGWQSVTVGVALAPSPGYPFPLTLAVEYLLAPDSLTVIPSATNVGELAAPFGLGMHPYLSVALDADSTTVTLPVRRRQPLDEFGSPAGPSQPFDGALGPLGDRVYDAALTDLVRDGGGWAHAVLSGPDATVRLSVDRAFSWLMLFTADTLPGDERRKSIAVEPMTCPPNAFATGTDVVRLEPGATWRGQWRLTWPLAGG